MFVCIFFSFVVSLAATKDCEFLAKNKAELFTQKFSFDKITKEELQSLSSCELSLQNQSFTKKLYRIANEIRGNNGACGGIYYYDELNSFNLLLAKIPFNPKAYIEQSKSKDYEALRAYFRYWGYQSIGNFRLYRDFWQEYESALNALSEFFIKNHKLSARLALNYSQSALNEFLNRAVGETRIFKDISHFASFIINKTNDLSQIQAYIYTQNPTELELNLALQAALLTERNKDIIFELIKFGAKINEGYENALFFALESYDNVKFLLSQKVNVEQPNSFGKSALFYAVEFNRKDIVRLLLENKANVNAKYISNNEKLALIGKLNAPYYITLCALEHTSKTVFMHAASYADVEMLKLLVENKANINAVDDLGFNALDFAIASKKEENINYLRSLGLKENEQLFFDEILE
ncbi:ankyrin repeat domain-containing protein [Campylobacter troglodytis]|uniref:ankyrin repeat domain-containing protein n=1 Tax=Campylobacter troglodytis TaxID=654363 RepID=UPI00115B0BCF|nr:hypothetical protein DMC01_10160 [Campylobacter troglodytis]